MTHYTNISRHDDPSRSTFAWVVRVQRKNRIMDKMFSDSVFGGKDKSLAAALAYRDALILAASPAAHNQWRRTIVRRNNKSGIPGVGLFTRSNGNERWIAFWDDEFGRHRTRSFSVQRHGEEKAKEMAIAERQKQLERIFAIKSSESVKNLKLEE
jgi:hypothetical protein